VQVHARELHPYFVLLRFASNRRGYYEKSYSRGAKPMLPDFAIVCHIFYAHPKAPDRKRLFQRGVQKMNLVRTCALVMVCSLCLSALLAADTLVLRDGRRVEGELVAVQNGVIEFQSRGPFGPERARINRADVARIEFESMDRDFREERRDEGRDDRQPIGNQRPAGLREREVAVDAKRPWSETGIEVRSGQTIYFSASGRIHWGPGRENGPEGEHDSPRNSARPIPTRPGASLIGRVGEGNDYFFIGDDKGAIRMRSAGRLYLGINDDNLADNSGIFRVTVFY
jgi:hypothetical protein